jgi:hypothetical protein
MSTAQALAVLAEVHKQLDLKHNEAKAKGDSTK